MSSALRLQINNSIVWLNEEMEPYIMDKDRYEEKNLARKRAASVLIEIANNHKERIAELMKQREHSAA